MALASMLFPPRTSGDREPMPPSFYSVNHMIDSVLLYAFEMGTLTTVGTIASMVTVRPFATSVRILRFELPIFCAQWLVMDYNLIFMGLHFFIAKCACVARCVPPT